MKTLLAMAAAALALATAPMASAQPAQTEVTGAVGAGFPTGQFDRRDSEAAFEASVTTKAFGTVFGIQPGVQVNVLDNTSGGTRIGGVNATTVMGTATLPFENATRFTPYVKAGAGYGWLGGSGDRGRGTDGDGATYLLGAGLKYRIGDLWAAGVEYERIGAFDADVRNNYYGVSNYKQDVALFTLSRKF